MMGTYGAPTQVWEAGFNGLYNDDVSTEPITSKVGMPLDRRETRKERIHKARMQKRFERDIISRAEMFKSAFSKFDFDGDGKLSYGEFSKGLQELGVKLPEHEMRAIWSEEANGKPWQAMEEHVAAFSGQLPHRPDQYHGNDKARVGARSLRIPPAHNKYRSPKVDVEEKSRTAVQRKMMTQFAHRGGDVTRSFKTISKAKALNGMENPDLLSFAEYQQCMKDLGALLSEEDLGHLWDTCQRKMQTGDEHGQLLSLNQLASALGTDFAEPPIVSDAAVDRTIQKEKTASLAREKLLHQLREKKQQLSNSFLISDERGTGMVGLGEFKSCLRSAGLLLGDEDCRAVLESCEAGSGNAIEYSKFLSSFTEAESDNIERLVSTPAPSRRIFTDQATPDIEPQPRSSPMPPYHSDDFAHGFSASRSANPPEALDVDLDVGQSLQEQLPQLKKSVGQRAGQAETELPVSIWEFKQRMAELGIHVDGQNLRSLYETARVDLQGRIDCDLLVADSAAGSGSYGGVSNVFEAETPQQSGRRSHPFTPKTPKDPADVSRIVERIAASKIGNPYKLTTMFRKYDEFPRHNKCSVEEFVQVVMDGAVDIPRAEASSLAERLVGADGQIDYLSFVGVVREARKRDSQSDLVLEVSLNSARDHEVQGEKSAPSTAPSHSPARQKLAFGAPAHVVIDRASWIEDVVSNSMSDVNRFERQRLRAVAGPRSTGTKVLHVRVPPLQTSA